VTIQLPVAHLPLVEFSVNNLTRSIECSKCKGDLWDMWGTTARCSNCGYERPYHRRNSRDDKVTPSQERALQVIKKYFDGSKFSLDGEATTEITKWKTELQKGTGIYYISVEIGSGNIWSLDGGHFGITRRGAIRVLSVYRVSADKGYQAHIAKMVGGKVGW